MTKKWTAEHDPQTGRILFAFRRPRPGDVEVNPRKYFHDSACADAEQHVRHVRLTLNPKDQGYPAALAEIGTADPRSR